MPFECDLAMGAIRFDRAGPHTDFLLLTSTAYQDKKTLSDLSGQDPKYHENDPEKLVGAVRAFLSAKKSPELRTRGAAAIWSRYQLFSKALPRIAKGLRLTNQEIRSFDYLPDWLGALSKWLLHGGGRPSG